MNTLERYIYLSKASAQEACRTGFIYPTITIPDTSVPTLWATTYSSCHPTCDFAPHFLSNGDSPQDIRYRVLIYRAAAPLPWAETFITMFGFSFDIVLEFESMYWDEGVHLDDAYTGFAPAIVRRLDKFETHDESGLGIWVPKAELRGRTLVPMRDESGAE